jgi:hypothetical protein
VSEPDAALTQVTVTFEPDGCFEKLLKSGKVRKTLAVTRLKRQQQRRSHCCVARVVEAPRAYRDAVNRNVSLGEAIDVSSVLAVSATRR